MITAGLKLNENGHVLGYRIDVDELAIIVRGKMPVDDFRLIEKLSRSYGFDVIDTGLSTPLNAAFVLTNEKNAEKLRNQIDEKNARLDSEDAWIRGYDTGISSKVIFSVMTSRGVGYTSTRGNNHPYDPDDFGRCYRLLEKFPEWRERLHEVKEQSPQWSVLIDHWDELETLYLEEKPAGKAPKLYKRMKELLDSTRNGGGR